MLLGRRGAAGARSAQRFKEHFGCEIIDGIGSTEMLHIFISNRPGDMRYGTTGTPVEGYEIELRGEDGQPVADGEVGDLYIKGPSAALMYWGNREKSADTFRARWTKSGDKYSRDADGYYTYAGRSDDMLKVSGIYVSPFEVEATLMQHPAVLEAAVIGKEDADGLTKTKAYVVLQGRAAGDGRRAQGLRQGAARALQVPALHRVRRRAAEDGHRQDPALPAARAGAAGMSAASPSSLAIDWRGRAGAHRIRSGSRRERTDAPLLVFLHEGLGSIAMWKDFPERLCEAGGFRGLVFSRPGYGRSTPREPEETWDVDFMHRQAHEVLPAFFEAHRPRRRSPGSSATATAPRSRCSTPRASPSAWPAWWCWRRTSSSRT